MNTSMCPWGEDASCDWYSIYIPFGMLAICIVQIFYIILLILFVFSNVYRKKYLKMAHYNNKSVYFNPLFSYILICYYFLCFALEDLKTYSCNIS